MTLSMFDPICFGQYPKGKEPIVLHFQYESSGEDIFRYVLVDRIPLTEIDIATRRKAGESMSAENIRDKYLNPPVVPAPEVKAEVVVPAPEAKVVVQTPKPKRKDKGAK